MCTQNDEARSSGSSGGSRGNISNVRVAWNGCAFWTVRVSSSGDGPVIRDGHCNDYTALAQVLTVSDEQIRGAMYCTAEQLKQVVEPAGGS